MAATSAQQKDGRQDNDQDDQADTNCEPDVRRPAQGLLDLDSRGGFPDQRQQVIALLHGDTRGGKFSDDVAGQDTSGRQLNYMSLTGLPHFQGAVHLGQSDAVKFTDGGIQQDLSVVRGER